MLKKSRLKIILPLVVILLGVAGAVGMIAARPNVTTSAPAVLPPLVRTIVVQPQDIVLRVRTQGTVEPRTESSLIPEVSGRVMWVSPSLAAGGFFEAGDPLLRIEKRDYEVTVARQRATLERRESEVLLAEANLVRSRSLAEKEVTSDAELDQSENGARVARAAVREARSALDQAEDDLARTEILAPFAGRVRREQVDLGQFVVRGSPVATLYSIDYAEIRLPVPDEQLAYLDLPLLYRGEADSGTTHEVVLTTRFAGKEHSWRGRVVRTEGEIDPRSRMVNVVAEVEDPYGRSEPGRPPLAVGLFVTAEILGHPLKNVVVLPREAVRHGAVVLVVDAEGRLRFRQIDILRSDREQVVLRAGLSAGERVCVSPLDAVADGMLVRVLERDGARGQS